MLYWLSRIKYSFVAFQSVREIPHSWFLNNVSIQGIVTRVGDGDGFRLLHHPKYPLIRHSNTLSVRLAGVDAPEVLYRLMQDGAFRKNTAAFFAGSKGLVNRIRGREARISKVIGSRSI
jgi:endonuclease YncB( thermonuclease family)